MSLLVVLVCPTCGGDAGEHDPLGDVTLAEDLAASAAKHECTS